MTEYHSCDLPRPSYFPLGAVCVCGPCGKLHRLEPPHPAGAAPVWKQVHSANLPFPIYVIRP